MDHAGFNDDDECPDSSRCGEIMDLGYNGAAENVLWNQKSLDEAVAEGHNQWMTLQGHYENIMNPSNTAVGYGYYVCANNDNSMDSPAIYMTGLFGAGGN